MVTERLHEALEIAQSETLEMEALEVMRNPAYGTCYEIAEAFLKTKRSLIEMSKEMAALKATEQQWKELQFENWAHVIAILKECVKDLNKEIKSAPVVYSHRCGNKQDDIWDAWSNEEPWDRDTHKARLVRIEELK